MDRDCNKCIHHISGSCSKWNCEMETLEEHDKKVRADAIDECLHAIGGLSISWEYGQGVRDCYDAIEKLKEQT